MTRSLVGFLLVLAAAVPEASAATRELNCDTLQEGIPHGHLKPLEGNLRLRLIAENGSAFADYCIADLENRQVHSSSSWWRGEVTRSWNVPAGHYVGFFEIEGSVVEVPTFGMLPPELRTKVSPEIDLRPCRDAIGMIEMRIVNRDEGTLVSWNSFCEANASPPPASARTWDGTSVPGTQVPVDLPGFAVAGLGLGLLLTPRGRIAFLSLFSRIATIRPLDSPRRRQLLDAIASAPGIHGHGLAEALELGQGQLQYHIGILERHQVIETLRMGRTRHFFEARTYSEEDKRAFAILRNPTSAQIYEALAQPRRWTVSSLATEARVSKSAASKALARLERAGLVERPNAASLDGATVRKQPRFGAKG